jgi:hypothetical protein
MKGGGNQPRRKSSQEFGRGDNVAQVTGNKTSKTRIQDGTLKAITVEG